MIDALRDTAAELATAAYAVGGCAFPSASTKTYDELPADLPALCVGPIRMAAPAAVARTGGTSGAGRVTSHWDVDVLVCSPLAATGAAGTEADPEFGGPDGADEVAERLFASFVRAGFAPVAAEQAEDTYAGREVYATFARFRLPVELSYDAL